MQTRWLFTLLGIATQATTPVLLQQPLLSHVVLSAQLPLLLPRFTSLYHRSLYRSAGGAAASSGTATTYSDTTTALTSATSCGSVTVAYNPNATADTTLPLILASGDYRCRRLRR